MTSSSSPPPVEPTLAVSRPCCSIGAREDAAAIDEALRRGVGVRGVAAHFDAPKSSIGDHRRDCLGITGKVEPVAAAALAQGPHQSAPPDTAADGPEKVSAGRPENPRTSGDDARARARVEPKLLISFEDRVNHCADVVASGRWLGRPTAKRLARLWNVDRGTVQNYHRSAVLIAKADRGGIEETREASLGHWTHIRVEALAKKDLKAASTAQAGYDRASGVVEAGGLTINLNHPDWQRAWAVVRVVLERCHPEALETLAGGVQAWTSGGEEGLATFLAMRDRPMLEAEAAE